VAGDVLREAMTSAEGFGTGDTPWKAVQQAAFKALTTTTV